MECPNCHKRVIKDSKYCGYCGTVINDSVRNMDKKITLPGGYSGVKSFQSGRYSWTLPALLLIIALIFFLSWRKVSNLSAEAERIYQVQLAELKEERREIYQENENLKGQLNRLNELVVAQSEISETVGTEVNLIYTSFDTRLSNILYQGIENPVRISVPGLSGDQCEISVTNAKHTRQDDIFYINPGKPGNSLVIVYAMLDGKRHEAARKEYRVKPVPDPTAMIMDRRGGTINRNALLSQTNIRAVLEDFEFDTKFTVTGFTISSVTSGFVREITSRSNRFTNEQRNLIRSLHRGNRIYFLNIQAVGPDGSIRRLPPMSFVLN